MIYRLILFLLINFCALAIGSYFTRRGVPSDWYQGLNKAPWTPPGWVFGVAWSAIMICFSIYLAYLWPLTNNKSLLVVLFIVQWILNVTWNPVFFYFHQVSFGLVLITALTILVTYFLLYYWPELRFKSLLILPYLIWLLIATSLNGFVVLRN